MKAQAAPLALLLYHTTTLHLSYTTKKMTLPDPQSVHQQGSLGPELADKLRVVHPKEVLPERPVIRVVPLEFRGTTAEYTRIWLVNVALSIVTLGLYLPWARIRMRRYFYGNTFLEGHNFSYTASPVSLLLGYVVVWVLFVTFSLLQNIEALQWVSVVLLLLFVLLYPWLLYRSLRFQAHNTLHRGLRFGFGGGAGNAYLFYGLLPLTYSISLGLTVPLAQYVQRRYLVEGLRYGATQSMFRGRVGPVYLAYLMGIGGMVALWLVVIGLWAALRAFTAGPQVAQGGWSGSWPWLLLALISVSGYLGVGQFVRAQLLRYTLEQAQLGTTLRFRVRYRPLGLAWVVVSNLLVQVMTLGLAAPWAAIRKNRYLLSRIDVLTLAPLTNYPAARSQQENALGEAAAELFDIGINL